MLLLMLFALIAGAGTAITPCVLPVVPALLASSATGGRRRPVGIVIGLAITFTIAIVLLAQLVKGVGLASGAARTLAIVVLIGVRRCAAGPGPRRADRGAAVAARPLRPQDPRHRLLVRPRRRRRARLRVRAVRRPDPRRGHLGQRLERSRMPASCWWRSPTRSGCRAVLLLYAFGGRAVIERVRRVARGNTVNRTLGVVLLATGVLMVFNLDVRFEEALAKDTSLPAFLVRPDPVARELERRPEAARVAASDVAVRHRQQEAARRAGSPPAEREVAIPASRPLAPGPRDRARLHRQPGLVQHARRQPLTLAGLRGHVVLVDFWTYTCINCLRTLPFLKGLYAHYHRYGLDIVGVETPEFTFEQEASNVRQAISSDGIEYPVVQDNKYGTWDAWKQRVLARRVPDRRQGTGPALPVRRGRLQAGRGGGPRSCSPMPAPASLPPPMTARAIMASTGLGTPETYLATPSARRGS